MTGLRDKVVIVTGSGGAIGRAIAIRFARAGAIIGVVDKHAEGAAQTAAQLEAMGATGHTAVCDITDYQAVCTAVEDIEQAAGPIDVLVNCAGWDKLAFFLDTEPTLWDRLIAINLRGPINMSHAVLKRMAERKRGSVINIASDAGRVGSGGESVYAACKGGVIALTKSLAREMARHHITVNVVCPGPTDTPLFNSFLDEGKVGEKIHKALQRGIPLGRIGQPDDVSGAVVFLASDEASYITGQVISVSGGLTMHG